MPHRGRGRETIAQRSFFSFAIFQLLQCSEFYCSRAARGLAQKLAAEETAWLRKIKSSDSKSATILRRRIFVRLGRSAVLLRESAFADSQLGVHQRDA